MGGIDNQLDRELAMKFQRYLVGCLGFALVAGLTSNLLGQVFFTEDFDYADGDLTVVSGGLWTAHSGGAPDIQVVSGSAVVTAPGSQDNNRLTGAVAGVNDVWYYALRFSVELGSGSNINPDYFIHFKDNTFSGYNARLALEGPVDPANDFSLEIWASSGSDGQVPWVGDFTFGEEIIAVVEWNNGTGVATLWVNPVDINSTSVSDDEFVDGQRAVESIALRQDTGNSSEITIDVLATGTDFDAVLAEVMPTTGGPITVTPDTITTTRGAYVSGGIPEISASDHQDYRISRAGNDIQSRTEFEVKATSPTDRPTAFEVTLEGAVFARSNVVQTIELFDYDLGVWEQVDSQNANRSPKISTNC